MIDARAATLPPVDVVVLRRVAVVVPEFVVVALRAADVGRVVLVDDAARVETVPVPAVVPRAVTVAVRVPAVRGDVPRGETFIEPDDTVRVAVVVFLPALRVARAVGVATTAGATVGCGAGCVLAWFGAISSYCSSN